MSGEDNKLKRLKIKNDRLKLENKLLKLKLDFLLKLEHEFSEQQDLKK